MPTGYTAYIEDTENPSFPEFFWRCAHAFGGVAVDYQDGMTSPIVRKHKIPSYKLEWLNNAREDLEQARAMTLGEAQAEVDRMYTSELKSWEEREAKRQQLLSKYDRILAEVMAWEPPTPKHEHLKEFMIEQIETSTETMRRPDAKPKKWTAGEYLRWNLEHAQDYYERELADYNKAGQNAQEADEWLDALKASVPIPSTFKVKDADD